MTKEEFTACVETYMDTIYRVAYACPYNCRHNWEEGEDFPGVKEIEELLHPENIISASDEELIEKVIPRSEYHLTEKQTYVLKTCAKRVLAMKIHS